MNTVLLSVTKAGGVKVRPKICLIGAWLSEMGFEPDSLLMAIPEKNGMTFTLCDENIKKYSDLVRLAKEQNGKLMQIILMSQKGTYYPTLVTTGEYIRSGGLEIGDNLVVRYEYGVIKMRKIDFARFGITGFFDTKISIVGKSKSKHAHTHLPTIRLGGESLIKNGFEKDVLVTVCSEPNSITFQLQDEGIAKYSALVKYARENRMRLIQVSEIANRNKRIPHMVLTGACLERAGFGLDDVFVVSYKYGLMKLTKIDFETLGF